MATPWDFINVWKEHAADYPTFVLTGADSINGVGTCKYLSLGTVRKQVSVLSGFSYLNGQIIGVVADGLYQGEQIVSGGLVVLNPAAVSAHGGLLYQGRLKFLPLGGDGQDVNQGKKRKPYNFIIRVWKSLSGMFGQDEGNLYPISYTESVNKNDDDDVLFTGDIHYVPTESSWDDYCQPELLINEPLPFMALAVVIQSEISEDK